MYHVSIPMPQGIGGHTRVPHLATRIDDMLPSRTRGEQAPIRRHGARLDQIQFSDRARIHMAARPIPGADRGSLIGAARQAQQFLDQQPGMANSPFGKAVTMLIRGAADPARNDLPRDTADDGKALLMRAVETVAAFLAEHPRVADAPIGRSAAALAQGISAAISAAGDNSGAHRIDYLIEAAKRAGLYLHAYPKLAAMPLGQAVENLVNGVTALAEGNPLDADLQTLAKRVGYFVHEHPRLAESEFGKLVSHLVQGFPVSATTPPSATTKAGNPTPQQLMPAA